MGKHVHHDCIIAWLAGALIEYKDNIGVWRLIKFPSWELNIEYRVTEDSKPQYADVISAWANGTAIEYFCTIRKAWFDVGDLPPYGTKLRIKRKPIELDWSAVDTAFKYAARDENGGVWLFSSEPVRMITEWQPSVPGRTVRADGLLSSLKVGDVPWADSLVQRPEEVSNE